MAKIDPSYSALWHTTGTLDELPSIEQVIKQLHVSSKAEVVLHRLNTTLPDGWWSYDAVWTTRDGARIRARLNVHDKHPLDDGPREPSTYPLDYDPKTGPKSGFFHVLAEADQPWDPAWPSPLSMFLPRSLKPSYASVEYGKRNLIFKSDPAMMGPLIDSIAELPFMVAVFTHDNQSISSMLGDGDPIDTPLVTRLPASLYGRVIDFRVVGPMRTPVNKALARYDVQLPEDGAAILLPPKRRRGLAKSELEFPMTTPFVNGGDIGPLTASLSSMFTSQVLRVDQEILEEMQGAWTLLTEEEEREQKDRLLNEAMDALVRKDREIEELHEALAESGEFVQRFKESGDDIIKMAKAAEARAQKEKDAHRKTKKEMDRLLRMIRDSDLGKAMEAQQTAEANTEAAEELLDVQARELTALHQENFQLRQELARLGSTFTMTAIVEEKTPETWEELLELSSSLEHVVLGDIEGEVEKLRGHTTERTWIRRSWEALCALNDYAQLKSERGSGTLPHFRAYLQDPTAGKVISQTRYSSSESNSVVANSRFRAARVFPVPAEVEPSGQVLMESHVRIGSGKPPAPRMHFHDDTSGATGKIYVGHLGAHLPNYQTN